jgi:hypothetical protein
MRSALGGSPSSVWKGITSRCSSCPPEHNESLKGSLAGFSSVRIGEGAEWDDARALAWAEAARLVGGDVER